MSCTVKCMKKRSKCFDINKDGTAAYSAAAAAAAANLRQHAAAS